jgi:hypothetical protein
MGHQLFVIVLGLMSRSILLDYADGSQFFLWVSASSPCDAAWKDICLQTEQDE